MSSNCSSIRNSACNIQVYCSISICAIDPIPRFDIVDKIKVFLFLGTSAVPSEYVDQIMFHPPNPGHCISNSF